MRGASITRKCVKPIVFSASHILSSTPHTVQTVNLHQWTRSSTPHCSEMTSTWSLLLLPPGASLQFRQEHFGGPQTLSPCTLRHPGDHSRPHKSSRHQILLVGPTDRHPERYKTAEADISYCLPLQQLSWQCQIPGEGMLGPFDCQGLGEESSSSTSQVLESCQSRGMQCIPNHPSACSLQCQTEDYQP